MSPSPDAADAAPLPDDVAALTINGGRTGGAGPLRRRRPRCPRRRLPLGLLAPITVIVVITVLERSVGWRGPTLGPGPAGTSACARSTLTGTVTHVRDGDTIEVAGVAIRLSGIAAPESSEPGGPEATAAMRRLVAGRAVRCELDGTRTYDRCAGVCSLNGRDIGAAMVRMGQARDCARFSGGRDARSTTAVRASGGSAPGRRRGPPAGGPKQLSPLRGATAEPGRGHRPHVAEVAHGAATRGVDD